MLNIENLKTVVKTGSSPYLVPLCSTDIVRLQFNGEPHSYTRFNLTQNMEGDNSHVEMKLSSDVDEEAGGNGVGEHLNHNRNQPYVAQKAGRHTRTLVILAGVGLVFFLGEGAAPDRATAHDRPAYTLQWDHPPFKKKKKN